MLAPMAEIDWSGIRAAAVVIGVREAARQAAADIPEIERNTFVERVMKRSSREGWIVRKTEIVQNTEKTLSAPVRNGADSLARRLAEDSAHTRVGFSKAARKVATHLGEKAANALIERDTAQGARQWAEIAKTTHGWDAKQDGPGANVAVNIGIIGA